MSRILVADDNSNIQKMVGIALKDQGIEVVAVGNGEAAVRRIPDVHPDLVLADVFMPVKNGYEVCEFVKKDQRFSHIPVILLVGAFDPLDEHEAQRVGADGVLKKPFVPPEPLISMVKSALSRSGGGSGRPRPIPMPKRPAAPPAGAGIPNVEAAPAGPTQDELGIPPRPESVSFNEGETPPLAFGNLLETNATSTTPAEAQPSAEEYVAPAQRPALVDARKWSNKPAAKEESEEEEEPKGPWRRDESGEESIAAADSLGSVKDWRDFEEPAKPAPAHADVEPVEEESKASTSGSRAHEPAPKISEGRPAGGNSNATEAESFLTSHTEHTAQEETHEPVAAEENAEAPQNLPEQSKAYESVFTSESYPGLFVEEKPPTRLSLEDDSADAASAFAEISTDTKEKDHAPAASGAATPASNLWEEQVRQAAKSVAASWPSEHSDEEFDAPPAEHAKPFQAEKQTLEEWEVEDTPAGEVHTPQKVSPEPPARAAAPGAFPQTHEPPPAAVDIEAVVAKVLERLDPSIFQSVTQQLLKPVVEAIVRSELEKKR
ncbi:MAG TPA: response regulator [Candidatus Acidoferrales bacterium]